jgi:hypothetical protein
VWRQNKSEEKDRVEKVGKQENGEEEETKKRNGRRGSDRER